MNFGQNFFEWVSMNLQPIALVAIVAAGIWLLLKRSLVQIITFVVVAVFGIGFVFAPDVAKNVFVDLFNTLFN
ncbi:hypothetical protein [Listeria ilorinensis]|uniref:hypothetical protein n=1 Tax=Listeria ilorinensis TaxID=2867439 RepID=UPI001EF7470E|nr:hypothetical protein [Listeria ilorinensis]